MSYLRAAWSHNYVKGRSDDYIYDDGKQIVDYGDITNEGLVEILCHCIDNYYEKDEVLIKKYLKKKLAKRLNVELRKKKLSDKVVLERMHKSSEKLMLSLRGQSDKEGR